MTRVLPVLLLTACASSDPSWFGEPAWSWQDLEVRVAPAW